LPVAPIKDLALIVTGNTPPRKDLDNYGPGVEWIKSDNIDTRFHFLTKAEETLSSKGRLIGRIVPEGSTLITCIAGSPNSIGNAALADREVAFNQQINAAIPRPNVDPWFLYCQFLLGKRLIQNASTNSMKGMVSKGKFQEIQFLSPPFDEQRKFGCLFQKVIQVSASLRDRMIQSETLRGGLEQRAFRGEL
jgi:type I restriction enzyme S subunit